jgi:hypothetical protein
VADEPDNRAKVVLPPELVAHAVWAPTATRDDPTRVVYVTERARRRTSVALLVVIIPAVVLTLVFAKPTTTWWLLVMFVIAGGSAAGYHRGGRAGFYQFGPDGVLGSFLGRKRPDLSAMRRLRPSN